MEAVVLRVGPIDVIQVEAALVAFHDLFQRGPQREQVVDLLVGAHQPVVVDRLQLLNRRLDVLLAEEVFPALVVDAIDPLELFAQDPFQHNVRELPLSLGHHLLGREVGVAQVDQELEGGNLREIHLVNGEELTHF